MTNDITFVAKGHIEAVGEVAACKVAAALIKASMWFEMTPLPDDLWSFETKGEAEKTLKQFVGCL